MDKPNGDQELKVAVMCTKGCLGNVLIVYLDLVVSGMKVELRKSCYFMQFIKQLINNQDWETVLYSGYIQGSIINIEAPGIVPFFTSMTDEEKRLQLLRMTPKSKSFCTCFSISAFWELGYL